jgi:hypothetical protein
MKRPFGVAPARPLEDAVPDHFDDQLTLYPAGIAEFAPRERHPFVQHGAPELFW